MRKTTLAMLLVALCVSFAGAGNLHPDLAARLNQTHSDDFIPILIILDVQGDYQDLMSQTEGMDRYERREYVITVLQDIAGVTQRRVKDYLRSFEPSGKVQGLQSLWIVNALYGRATPQVIRGLEGFPEIAEVRYDPEEYLLFNERSPRGNVRESDGSDEIVWGVLDINADQVWSLGYDGTGVVVGVIDTGVNYNHVDLADHMWNGGPAYPNHGWDFYNNDNDPMDDGSAFFGGHGTHVSGTVASDGTAGSQCGVAPNASIMAIKVLSGDGYGTEGPVLDGIEFAVNQGADIFTMSLGWQTTSQRNAFRTACNNALAAGVIGTIAAGNEGNQQWIYPIPGNVRTPGDVPPPWLHPDQTLTGGTSCVVTVGATNSSHTIAGFSSRGPVTWENVGPWYDYAYSGGSQMGLIDPDVCAPGENIKSLDFNNIWGYVSGWSGTSMATPHVAGTVALMLDKNPNLTPAELDMYLETTALDWGSAGKDNTYGAGRIDALAAVNAVPGGGGPPDVSVTLTPTGSTSLPASGGTLYFDVSIQNNEPGTTYTAGWLEWTYPDGTSSGALVLRNLSLAGGGSLSRSLVVTVAGSEPNGNYTFWGRLGSSYGGTIYAEDSFPFSKGTSGDTGQWVSRTQVFGWEEESVTDYQPPDRFELGQNYPNPFNPVTTIPFSLPEDAFVSLKVFDLQGREAAVILEGELSAGHYEATFDASPLPSGVYLVRLQAGSFNQTKKLTLIK